MRTITSTEGRVIIGIMLVVLLVGAGVGYVWAHAPSASTAVPVTQTPDPTLGDSGGVRLGQTITLGGVTITPLEVLEDSRCPTDVQCIQAGRVRVRVQLETKQGTTESIFLIGEPVTSDSGSITLIDVHPVKVSTIAITNSDYRFVFKAVSASISYHNASAAEIQVDTPQPGAVTGKSFEIRGQVRGWFFEGSFPVTVLDKRGASLAQTTAHVSEEWSVAGKDWMSPGPIPFVVRVTLPEAYIGPATVVLQNDNASGLPANDKSISWPITVEY